MTEATHETGQQAGLVNQASTKVGDATSAVQEKAKDLRESGSARVQDQLDHRSTQVGSEMRSLAEALRRSSQDLEDDGSGSASQLASQAADRIERLGKYLEEKRGEELFGDIETFARRRPWALAGLGLLAGMAAARFTKASSERRYAAHQETGGWPRPKGSAELPSGSSGVGSEPAPVGAGAASTAHDAPAREPHGV